MRVFSQVNNCQQKQTNKQNKRGGAPLLGLAKSIYYEIKSGSIFEEETAARLNLADKILFLITLCDFKKSLSYRIRTDQPVLSYLKLISILKPLKQSEKTENDISCILLTFSCLVPMLSVLKIYNN